MSLCNIQSKKKASVTNAGFKMQRDWHKNGEGKSEIHPGEMRRKYHGFLFKGSEAPSVQGMWARRAWGLLGQIHESFFPFFFCRIDAAKAEMLEKAIRIQSSD